MLIEQWNVQINCLAFACLSTYVIATAPSCSAGSYELFKCYSALQTFRQLVFSRFI